MSNTKIRDLFASDIERRIEEVIKVDQTDQQILQDELQEYVVTDTIKKHYVEILDVYRETPNKPHEGIGIWVSGFFGSGKSSFAKILGLALENRAIGSSSAAKLFGLRTGDNKVQVLLSNISEQIPTDAVIFDVSTDRGIRSGNQTLTEIMYRMFLQHLGYAKDLDLSELEINLEAEDRLDSFKSKYQDLYQKDWDSQKGKIAFAISEASRVMHELEPDTYPSADSWSKAAQKRADITPGLLAERCKELMKRRNPDKALVFVIDEVGQFVARDVQKMLDLQAIVQNLGRIGRGKMWIVVTSQEKLNELVGGLDDKRVELARLMDRFPAELQVHLEPSDISEVTSKRVLAKNAGAEKALRHLFEDNRGRITDNSRLTADIRLPELTAENFIDLYPLLPYQVDLIIQVVSGLRMQGGASKHVGGANRTIIKLAQQLLIHPDVDLAGQTVGKLARIDHIYDLVEGNIGSEIRGKIATIPEKVDHPLAQSVAKTICLLQYVKSIHRTTENIAAALLDSVGGDSRQAEVKEALDALTKALMVRQGDDGYRIPTPAEDDWERQRSGLSPKPGDVRRIHSELMSTIWQPQPAHTFLDTKVFKAGLFFNGKQTVDGDIPIHMQFAEAGDDFSQRQQEMRTRSQAETKSIFWVVEMDAAIDRETVEIFRSKEILSRKERGAQTKDETAMVAEEKTRLRRHQDELKRLVRQACLTGAVYFRGNDRSPGDEATDVIKTAEKLLAQALPEVFDRFEEAAARVKKQDLEDLLTNENLRGLPGVFAKLRLVKDQGGKPVFETDTGPLAEILVRIENRTSYGENATGRYLSDEFAKEPFGWEFDMVRLLVVSLVRAGKVEATSKGQVIESALSIEARDSFTNNNLFRQCSFRPKVGIEFTTLVQATQAFKDVFGKDIQEIEQSTIAKAIREGVARNEACVQDMRNALVSYSLPGVDVLQDAADQIRAIRGGNEEQTILSFNSAFKEIKEAIKRATELKDCLTEPALQDLKRARSALRSKWAFLQQEADIGEICADHAKTLKDLLAKETFFRELPAIDQNARAIDEEYQLRYDMAVQKRVEVYTDAVAQLRSTPGYSDLTEAQQSEVATPLEARTKADMDPPAQIPLLRSDIDACSSRLTQAIETVMRLLAGSGGPEVVRVRAADYFKGGIESEEQLKEALAGLKEICEKLIGEGKKVLIQ
jgi:hypothetical protein